MKSILQELYENGLSPSENPPRILAEHQRLRQEHFSLYDEFVKNLSEKQKEQFNTLWDQIFENFRCGDCESFIYGFQLGARIMIEVFAFPSAT